MHCQSLATTEEKLDHGKTLSAIICWYENWAMLRHCQLLYVGGMKTGPW